ncbi:uncharacterized protein J7T54_002586 [Emericellopsis cladophorae]|uniref:Uncharacterized protein n=1 Tax=Emericellopsis cladophorae TaxID=2686198 RepID=A0A9P9Y0B6_9HYPO|nr:uncharacterized protein J7T54_002586 [Emericellopsis cladophorae]KAI6781228.1 hypothetical protein J7T54_002586 [Emericellopsis cladophorae]
MRFAEPRCRIHNERNTRKLWGFTEYFRSIFTSGASLTPSAVPTSTISPTAKTSNVPVTTRPSANAPPGWRLKSVTSPEAHLKQTARRESETRKEIFQYSFYPDHNISPASNGLVSAALQAYSSHHHLILRSEDAWFVILMQLSFYINANAEKLRNHFVARQGKKELVVEEGGTIRTVNLGRMAVSMTGQMHKFVVDKDLRQWILPDFSTTNDNDTVVAAALFMGAMQEYFKYTYRLLCGIPSVTLGRSMTGFAFGTVWRKLMNGALMRKSKRAQFKITGDDDYFRHESAECELDGITFEFVENIPLGYTKVPVRVDDNETEYDTEIVAGMVGVAVSSSGEGLDDSNPDTLYGLSDGVKDKTTQTDGEKDQT